MSCAKKQRAIKKREEIERRAEKNGKQKEIVHVMIVMRETIVMW
jgi:hypothetical protein